MAKKISMTDLDRIAPLLGSFHDYLVGDPDGQPLHKILEENKLTVSQRRLLLARADDVLVIFGLAAVAREIAKNPDLLDLRELRSRRQNTRRTGA